MRELPYKPGMFRAWHDGPVVIIDMMAVKSAIDAGHAMYVVANSSTIVEDFLNMIKRPYAGTVYIVATASYAERLAEHFSHIDIVRLIV